MPFSATSSRRRAAGAALLLALAAAPAGAKVFLSVDEAVKLAFADAQVTRQTAFLTPEQVARAKALAGVEVASALVTFYTGRKGGQIVGTAYFDTHRVRTLPETLMIVVDAAGAVRRLEIVSFREPEEYIPRGNWYRQFLGRKLDPELALKRAIHPATGASLTARATTEAVRRALALHRVLAEGGKGGG